MTALTRTEVRKSDSRLLGGSAPLADANVEAEAAFLGAVLIDNGLVDSAGHDLTPAHFYEPVHAKIFERLLALRNSGKTVTTVTLRPYFENDEGLAELGGVSYLARLTGESIGLFDTRGLAQQIIDLAQQRSAIAALEAALDACRAPEANFSQIVRDLSDAVQITSPASSLPFFWFEEAEPNLDANDFVEGLLTSSAMSVVYGPSNCGKTFFMVDLGLHVSWGRDWRGRAVDKGAVVYLSLEGAQGIRNRLAAFKRHHGLEGERLPFVVMPKPINLLNCDADVNAVIALVFDVAQATGLPVRMVIVDTLSRAMAGGNENAPEDMTALVANIDRLRAATGVHVNVVHHSGKDEAKGARGHSSLRAATDTEIEIKRDAELTFSTARVAKQRDMEAGDPFAFSLQQVVLGSNRRGKHVTSCVVVDADKSVTLARDPDQLSPKEALALKALETCITAGGVDVATGRNNDVARGVAQANWKRSLQAQGVIDRNNDHVARTQFARVRKALQTKGEIKLSDEHVWRAQQ